MFLARLARLARRQRQPELMDAPDLDPEQHVRALRGLARINLVSASAGILWGPLAELARSRPGPLRVLDVATGGGDVPLRLWRRARRAGLALELAGCDVSPTAVAHARDAARFAGAPVEFFRRDALAEGLPAGFDVLTCSLFLHHLDEGPAAALLGTMGRAAGALVLVNDLVRSRAGYVLARLGTLLLTASPVARVDGPRSVEAAFTPAEALALAERAGLAGATVRRRWPCRYLLAWRRPA